MSQAAIEAPLSGWIFDIKRFAIHDGPGIRTTVFLKGCPLQCKWCDNPESQLKEPHLVYWQERCISCNACLAACPRGAIVVASGGDRLIDVERCDLCGCCVEACYSGALEQVGRLITVDELFSIIEEDRPFYEESGGGVTLSGGEPLAQPAFTQALLRRCQEEYIHTAIETCGHAPPKTFEAILPHVDLILYDLKELDPDRHQQFTGVSPELILGNLRALADCGPPIIVRRPVIPGYNDAPGDSHALGRFLEELDMNQEVHLLPYHRLGRAKYRRLGRDYPLAGQPSLDEEQVTPLKDILESYGLQVAIGG
jgi:pyruvate formate lyase activating enzyme